VRAKEGIPQTIAKPFHPPKQLNRGLVGDLQANTPLDRVRRLRDQLGAYFSAREAPFSPHAMMLCKHTCGPGVCSMT
jgi:hypothetical protein